MNKHPKKISEEIIDENPYWKHKKDIFEKPNGEQGEYHYGETPGAVMLVPIMEDGKIMLIRQYRYLTGRYSVEFPCGGMKSGEKPQEAAARELKEETGGIIDDSISVGSFEPSNGWIKDLTHIYIVHVSELIDQQLDEAEDIEVLYRRPDEISTMIRQNEISCGQTLAAWAMAQNYFSAPQSDEVAPGFKMISDYFLPGE
jgi:ADP-ribose pyrophosphatase